jgi:transmembrane 9 superfamily protein 2/4
MDLYVSSHCNPSKSGPLHVVTIIISIGGILPFGAVSVELYFIMSALWLHQIYYIFGFLFLVLIVLVATCAGTIDNPIILRVHSVTDSLVLNDCMPCFCAEIAILLCYFQLCNEDYRWWWRSFLTSGACAGPS